MKIFETGLERTNEFRINRIEIVIDELAPTKVELYILDSDGSRIEGGSFDRSRFMDHIYNFYNANL